MLEAGREVGQAFVEVAGFGGELDGLGYGAVALEGVEAEMGASGVEGHHYPAVVVVHRTVFQNEGANLHKIIVKNRQG